MCVYFFVFGSYIPSWRLELFSGNFCAEGWLDPFLKTSGFSDGRTVAVIQTRPLWSIIGLWTLALLVQITSSPKYMEGAGIAGEVGLVFGSRTVKGIFLVVWRTGSRTGK